MVFRYVGWLLVASLAGLGAVPESVKSWVSQPASSPATATVSESSAPKAQKISRDPVAIAADRAKITPAQISNGVANVNHSSPKWGLLSLVAVSAVGGGLAFFVFRRQSVLSRSSPLLESSMLSPKISLEDAIEPSRVRETPEEPAAHSASFSQSHLVKPSSVSEPSHPKELSEVNRGEESQVSETTRLAKISIVDELLRELRTPDPTKRQKIIWELGQRGDTRAVQPMVDLLIDSDSKQRSLILSALSEIGTRTLKPLSRALAISLQDESADVRKNAIRDLTRVYDLVSQMSHLLHQASDDPDQEVQETALWALGQFNRLRSTPSQAENLPAFKPSASSPENPS